MKVEICSCGHDKESHFQDCFDCKILKRQKCLKFVHTFDATLAKVNSVYIDNNDDHGLKVFYVDMDFSACHQSMQVVMNKKNKTSIFAKMLIKETKKFFSEKDLANIKDRYCYALHDANEQNGHIKGILAESILGYENSYVIITKELFEKSKEV